MSAGDARAVWDKYWNRHHGYVNHTPQLVGTISDHCQLPGLRVLEVGVGTGGNSIVLSKSGASVIAADYSREGLCIALGNAANQGESLILVECDANALPFGNETFDLVFHQGLLEHFQDVSPILLEQARVLRKGGLILVDVPQSYNLYTPYKHLLMRLGRWSSGGWETQFSHRQLCRHLFASGCEPIASYGRGVFPYWISGRNQLRRVSRVLGNSVSARSLRLYDGLWARIERSFLGRNVLQCVGVLARKV